ncbi:MAG: hypothetical protein EOM18_15415 [Clostridia bacterium]|nr:hypothetical protein [Clostridia bacterium]
MAESYDEVTAANIQGSENTGVDPEWSVDENCDASANESLSHMAYRAVRTYLLQNKNSLPLPVFPNEYVGDVSDDITSEDEESARREEEKLAAVYEVSNYSQQGYTMEMKVYLDLNQEQIDLAQTDWQNRGYLDDYLSYMMACDENVRLITVISCKKDEESYQIRTYYTAKVRDDGESDAHEVYWSWERERSE